MRNKTLIYFIVLGYVIQLAGYRYSIRGLHLLNLIVASSALGIWATVRTLTNKPIKLPMFWPIYLAAIGSLIISSLYSVWIPGSEFELILWGICIVIFVAVINLPWDHRSRLLDGMLWVGLVYNSTKLVEAVRILLGDGLRSDGRLTIPNNAAAFVNLIIIISISQIIQSHKKSAVAWIGLGSSLVVLWFTGSRGGSIAGMAGITVVLIAAWLDNPERWAHPWLVAAGDLIGSGLFIYTSNLNRLPAVINDAALTIQYRLDVWNFAESIWGDHLWIGAGPNTFYYLVLNSIKDPNPIRWIHPHNQLMQILAELGIVGLFTGSLLLLMMLAWLLFFQELPRYKWIGLATLATMITHGLIDMPWYEPFVMRSIILLLAISLAPLDPTHQDDC